MLGEIQRFAPVALQSSPIFNCPDAWVPPRNKRVIPGGNSTYSLPSLPFLRFRNKIIDPYDLGGRL